VRLGLFALLAMASWFIGAGFSSSDSPAADGIVGPRTMAKLFEEEQLPNSIQGRF